jgi:putative transport protein
MIITNYLALFLIITLGFILGKVKIRGISLDISAIIFVALLFGHFGVELPADFQYLGLILFIFTIGIQAGPGFFQSFKLQGAKIISVALILVFVAALTAFVLMFALDINHKIAVGLLTGALTSTPGLAAAIDSTKSSLASIGYGVAYPFGVLGVILFVRILPRLLRIDLEKEEQEIEKSHKTVFPEIFNKYFRVENPNVFGKSIGFLNIRTMTGASISRVKHLEEAITPTAQTVLEEGDIIKAVGTSNALNKIELLIGKPVNVEIPLGDNYEIQSILVTNKDVVNKTIGQLNLLANYSATITRIRRSGIDIAPNVSSEIKFGDKLLIACHKEHMKAVSRLFGNEDKKLSDTDFFPIAAGIVLGILVGKINIVFSPEFSFSPGLSGGILFVALILGNLGKTGPIVWSMSATANQLLRQLGLFFFLASVGTQAGAHLVETFQTYGFKLFLTGAAITILPMMTGALVGHYIFKINIFALLGIITGGMTSTPGLAAIDPMTRNNMPHVAYATVYPVAMVAIMIFVQILSLF